MYYVNLKPYHSFTVLFDCEEQFERCIIYSLQTKLVNNPGYPFFLMPIINLVNKYTSLKARDISLHVIWWYSVTHESIKQRTTVFLSALPTGQ